MNATVIPRTTSRKTRRWEGLVTVPCEELSAIRKSFPFQLLENNTNLFTRDNQRMHRRQATAAMTAENSLSIPFERSDIHRLVPCPGAPEDA
jgi:hypothetical protein